MSEKEKAGKPRPAAIALGWWAAMQPMLRDGTPNPGADKAALAELRRCGAAEAMAHRATMDLYRALPDMWPHDLPRVAVLAGVLATARRHAAGRPLGRVLGVDGRDKELRPRLSPLRLQRLLRAEEPDDRLTQFRRAIQLAGEEGFDLARLASDLLDPADEWRRRWAFDYHDASAADPDNTREDTPPTGPGETAP